MTDDPNTTNDNDANSLFLALTADASFALPALDFADTAFALPDPTNNDLYTSITRLTEADLTSRTVEGDGLFDGLMTSLRAHLKDEYEKGRITGNDYANAYIAMTQTALGTATQYLLGRDQAYYQNQLVQAQARTAEIEVVRARMATEITKAQLAQARIDTNNAAAAYALTKLQILTASGQYDIQQAELGKVNYELDNLLPAQLTQMSEQTSQITATKDKILYETANILPEQKLGLEKDTAIKTYQHDFMLPAQKTGHDIDVLIKTYQKDYTLPAQLIGIEEQNEAHRAKTMDTRLDGTTPIAGAVGKNKELQDQQIASYIAADQNKFVKLMTDQWSVTKSVDAEGVLTPSTLDNDAIDAVVTNIRTNLGV